jgi:hypothetical protein
LTLIRFDGAAVPVDLASRLWVYQSITDLIGPAGQIFIVGIPFTRRMHIWLRCPGRPDGDGTLRAGGCRYISGIWISHDASVRPKDPKDRKELPYDIDLGDLGPTGL